PEHPWGDSCVAQRSRILSRFNGVVDHGISAVWLLPDSLKHHPSEPEPLAALYEQARISAVSDVPGEHALPLREPGQRRTDPHARCGRRLDSATRLSAA